MTEHTSEAHDAITTELVRLTLGGQPTIHDVWLNMTLSGRLSRIAGQFQAFVEQVGAAMQPALTRLAQAMAALDPEAKP